MWDVKVRNGSTGCAFVMLDYNGRTKFTIDNLTDGTSILRTANGEKVAKISFEGFHYIKITKFRGEKKENKKNDR